MHFLIIFLTAVLIGFVISTLIGPVGILAIERSIEKGKRSGRMVGFGAALSDALYALVFLFSLVHFRRSFINIDFFTHYEFFFQLAAILILVFVALKLLRNSPFEEQKISHFFSKRQVSDFFYSFFINLTNPGVLFTFAFLFSFFKLKDIYLLGNIIYLIFPLGIFTGGMLWWFLLSSFIHRIRQRVKRDIKVLVKKVSGALLLIYAFVVFLFMIYHLLVS